MPDFSFIVKNSFPRLSSLAPFALAVALSARTRKPWLRLLFLLLSLNWRNLPGYWHLRVMAWIPIYRVKVLLCQYGVTSPPPGSRAKSLGLPRRTWPVPSIGVSPLKFHVTSKETVGWAEADFNGHMSKYVSLPLELLAFRPKPTARRALARTLPLESLIEATHSYAVLQDYQRLQLVIRAIGPLLAIEHVNFALAENRIHFFREIPLFATFDFEASIASYDDRWFYLYSRFLLVPTSSALSSATALKTINRAGQVRILAAAAVAKVCVKLPGTRHRASLLPARVLAMAGMGEDAKNWKEAARLRGERKAKGWLCEETVPEGMMRYEEKRKKGCALLTALDERKSWVELDEFVVEGF